jgi:hypothetical protein
MALVSAHISFDYHTVFINAWETEEEDDALLEAEAIEKLMEFIPKITKLQRDYIKSSIIDIEFNNNEDED